MNASKSININIPNNFSFEEALSFLDRGFDDCLYRLTDNSVTKLIAFTDKLGFINVYRDQSFLVVEVWMDTIAEHHLLEAKTYVEDWFDLNRNIDEFYQLLDQHSVFKNLSKRYNGSRIIGISNAFEATCWAIIGQQINLTFAYKLKRALVEKYGVTQTLSREKYYLFPTPKELLAAKEQDLKDMKFSRQKIQYLKNISLAFMDGDISKQKLIACHNKDERITLLTAIKGIGIWSANYVMMKSIRDLNCITYRDSGLNKAIQIMYDMPQRPTVDEVDVIFSDFEGWESYLNFYLWKTL